MGADGRVIRVIDRRDLRGFVAGMSAFGHADPQVLAIIDAGDAPTEQLEN